MVSIDIKINNCSVARLDVTRTTDFLGKKEMHNYDIVHFDFQDKILTKKSVTHRYSEGLESLLAMALKSVKKPAHE